MNLDLLRRPAVFGSIIGVIVVALIWWFFVMTPASNKLSSVNQQKASDQSQIASLTSEIAALKIEDAQVTHELHYLQVFQLAIPTIPQSGILTEEIYDLSRTTHTHMSSLDDGTVDSPLSNGVGYSTIPVSISISGGHNDVLSFIAGLYTLPRLVTIQSVNLSTGSGVNLNTDTNKNAVTATILATAYTTFVAPATNP